MAHQLEFLNEEIQNVPQLRVIRFRHVAGEGISSFLTALISAWKFVLFQPMILVFGLLQWCSIVISYLLWSQIWRLIPSNFHEGNTIANILVGNWSLTIIALVSFPVGILTGTMGVAYFLKKKKIKATFGRCLRLSMGRYKQLWIFTWLDGWITIEQILDRIDRITEKFSGENPNLFSVGGAIREILYFAWKVATLGIYPAILAGKNLPEAGSESLTLVRKNFREAAILRAGYSGLCWFVGLSAGLLGYFWARTSLDSFYSLSISISFPVAIATSIIMLVLRPVFIISSCELYSGSFDVNLSNVDKPVDSKSISWISIILLLLIALLFLWFFLLELYLG